MKNYNAVFLLGVPGSGKDFVLRTALKESSATEIPLDGIINSIQKNENDDRVDGRPLIINGNAHKHDYVLLANAVLEAMGYSTACVFVYTDMQNAITRNEARDRPLPLAVITEKYENSVYYMHSYKDMFDEGFFLFDNSNDFVSVNEETQSQIVSWLQELTGLVESYFQKKTELNEDVDYLFEKEFPTIVDMIANKDDKKQGDKYKNNGVKSAQNQYPKEVAESNQEISVKQTQKKGIKFRKNTPAKGAGPIATPSDSRIGSIPDGGTGSMSGIA